MSIQSEINRINQNVAQTYTVLADAGADMPAARNTDNLSDTAAGIKAVLYGKAQSLTEAQKAQARGNIGAISEVDVPRKGVDYWTDADQESIIQQVIAAIGTPVFGRVDAENNIILTGELADGTYTLKYEDADGNVTEIGTLNQSPGIVNQIPLSTNEDGTPYNGGQGYKVGVRLSSSGGESTSSSTNFSCSGFIPASINDVIYIKNMTFRIGNGDDSYSRINGYSADHTFLIGATATAFATMLSTNYTANSADNQLVSVPIESSVRSEWANVKYIRISWRTVSGVEPFLTINQPIE